MEKDPALVDVHALNRAERVVLADILLNDLTQNEAEPITAKQKALLLSRLEEAKNDPSIYQSWDEVRATIMAKIQ